MVFAMFSSPMSHYLRHVFLAYAQQGDKLNSKRILLRQLQQLELECIKMQKNSNSSKLQFLMERIGRIKSQL